MCADVGVNPTSGIPNEIHHQENDIPMASSPRGYRSFADFEREEIRPSMRIGWSVDEIEESMAQELDFDVDPFEAMLDSAEAEEDEDD